MNKQEFDALRGNSAIVFVKLWGAYSGCESQPGVAHRGVYIKDRFLNRSSTPCSVPNSLVVALHIHFLRVRRHVVPVLLDAWPCPDEVRRLADRGHHVILFRALY